MTTLTRCNRLDRRGQWAVLPLECSEGCFAVFVVFHVDVEHDDAGDRAGRNGNVRGSPIFPPGGDGSELVEACLKPPGMMGVFLFALQGNTESPR